MSNLNCCYSLRQIHFAGVSILVLMDVELKRARTLFSHHKSPVSILVLMDVELKQRQLHTKVGGKKVSILVLMDVELKRLRSLSARSPTCCFNPCFNGCRT